MAGDPARFFCAEAARERGDGLAGTAPHGRVWVLIEHPGGWPPNGFEGLGLEPALAARVFAAAQTCRARILLVRRPGRRRATEPRRWAVLHHDDRGAHRQTWGTWEADADLDGVVNALHSPGTTGHPPVVLVCAHGLHDVCCAVRGRPVAAALGARHPRLVWECTHVGGGPLRRQRRRPPRRRVLREPRRALGRDDTRGTPRGPRGRHPPARLHGPA
ncbi:sucraseferredoxin family protein, partial [Streptomyces sp. SPB78]